MATGKLTARRGSPAAAARADFDNTLKRLTDAAQREASREHVAALLRNHHRPLPDAATTHVLIDLPVGATAKVRSAQAAAALTLVPFGTHVLREGMRVEERAP